jgi:steroid delta-isomerase-like uncharacterized protein
MLTPEALVREWFERVWNAGDESAIDRLLADDAMIYDLPSHGQVMRGKAAFIPFYRGFRAALSEIHIEIDQLVASGEFAVAHCRVTGRHTGDGLGVPPSGRRVEFCGMAMGRIRDGKLVEGWNCFDFLAFYQQLGMLPALPS